MVRNREWVRKGYRDHKQEGRRGDTWPGRGDPRRVPAPEILALLPRPLLGLRLGGPARLRLPGEDPRLAGLARSRIPPPQARRIRPAFFLPGRRPAAPRRPRGAP